MGVPSSTPGQSQRSVSRVIHERDSIVGDSQAGDVLCSASMHLQRSNTYSDFVRSLASVQVFFARCLRQETEAEELESLILKLPETLKDEGESKGVFSRINRRLSHPC